MEEDPFGREVGAGEDWSHLNKRRQAMREKKVANDVRWMQQLERAKLGLHEQDAHHAQLRRDAREQETTTA